MRRDKTLSADRHGRETLGADALRTPSLDTLYGRAQNAATCEGVIV
jgi:hypothetical protein